MRFENAEEFKNWIEKNDLDYEIINIDECDVSEFVSIDDAWNNASYRIIIVIQDNGWI